MATSNMEFEIAHSIPGRVRFHSACLRDRAIAGQIGNRLPDTAGILGVRVNGSARSVVVEYDPELLTAEEIARLLTDFASGQTRESTGSGERGSSAKDEQHDFFSFGGLRGWLDLLRGQISQPFELEADESGSIHLEARFRVPFDGELIEFQVRTETEEGGRRHPTSIRLDILPAEAEPAFADSVEITDGSLLQRTVGIPLRGDTEYEVRLDSHNFDAGERVAGTVKARIRRRHDR